MLSAAPVAGVVPNSASVKCSLDPSHAPAQFMCIPCGRYLCSKCDAVVHGDAKLSKHVRFLVSEQKCYAVLDERRAEGESAVRRNWATRTGPIHAPLSDCKTLYDSFWRSVQQFAERPCLGRRTVDATGKVGPFEFQSYKTVGARVTDFAAGLRALGIDRRSVVGLYSVNRPEWCIAEHACYAQSMLPVPLYDTLGADAAQLVIAQSGISAVVCSADKLKTLRYLAESKDCTHLRLAVIMPAQPWEKPVPPLDPFIGHIRIVTFEEVEKRGKANPSAHAPPQPGDLATLCYTSGTTGLPKGAMLTHANMVSDVAAALHHGIDPGPNDVHISFLPLAHMFERLCHNLFLAAGASMGYARGDPLLLVEDVAALRPTIFVGVPRLFNRLHDKIRGGVAAAGGVKSMLFERAYASKLSSLRASGSLTSALWDRLVFGKIAGVLGGRVRLVVTGSAPIAANVLEFLRIVLSCPVIEGYGLTETTAAATVTLPKDVNSCGHVGVPLICNEVKLVDVPEMGFTAQDTTKGEPTPRGEIWIRGSNVFKGYYKNAEQTAASITPDGWFKTGDVGMWLRDGSLKIVGRKKDNFKLAQGEYIAPEKVENVYLRCKYVAQIFVYGDSLRSCLVAVVVPDEEQVRAWAKAASVAATEWPQLVKHPDLAGVVLKAMDKVADQERLNGFERVKAIALVDQPFSVDNGLLTPTLKLKRPAAEKAFKDIVTALYAQVDEKDAKAPKIKSKL